MTFWLWFLIAVCPSLSIPLLATGHTARRNQSSKTVKIVLKKFWWHTYRRKISRGSRIWGYFFDKPPQKWSKRAICFKLFEIWVFPKFLKSSLHFLTIFRWVYRRNNLRIGFLVKFCVVGYVFKMSLSRFSGFLRPFTILFLYFNWP